MIRSLPLTAGLIATSLVVLPAPAQAGDARLASRLYSADEIVRVEGRTGVQATIAFAEDEHIENVAVGDSTSWQVTPNKRANLLFVKPLAPRARTNMTVVTDQRTYLFDLVAAPSGNPLYVLRFTYPEAPKTVGAQRAASGLTAEEAMALGKPPLDPASLNFAWARRGDGKLLPAQIYDDGQATYVRWAAGAPIPAILVRDEKRAEGPVNFAVRGDVIVIDGVPALIVLRSGRASATLENQGKPRKPANPSAGLAAATPLQDQ